MSKESVLNHPRNPACQPFNISGSKCKSKRQTAWNPNSPTYFLNKGNKKTKQAFTQEDEQVQAPETEVTTS